MFEKRGDFSTQLCSVRVAIEYTKIVSTKQVVFGSLPLLE